MGIGLADEEEVKTVISGQVTPGLIPVEIITQQGDPVRGDMLGVFVNPPFAGHPLAVLFVVTVLRHEELRRQGNDL
jgi:hypothetical protein